MTKTTVRSSWVLLGLALLALADGCQPVAVPVSTPVAAPSPAPESKATPTAESAFPQTVSDTLGRKVTFAAAPRRIVSVAPKNTEILFSLGLGDRVVGVTSYCTYPLEAKSLPQVGGFSLKSISLEKIVALKPDLVVSAAEIHLPLITELERLGIPVLALGAESFEELYSEMRLLGELTERRELSQSLITSMQSRVRAVETRCAGIPAAERVSVFYQVWDDPLSGAGPKSYAGQLIALAGGTNIIEDVESRYPQISEEVILSRNPDVIVAPTMASVPVTFESLQARPGWSNLKAIQNHRVSLIDGDMMSRCAPRLVTALEQIAKFLYPDRFESETAGIDSNAPQTEPPTP